MTDKIEQAKKLSKDGNSLRDIASELKVSKSTIQRWLATEKKSFLDPVWHVVGGEGDRPVDAWGATPAPTAGTLISLNTDTVFSCTRWCANHVAKTHLRVLVTTEKHQKAPNCPTRPLSVIKSAKMETLGEQRHVRQVLSHPLVDLIARPCPELSKYDYLYYIDSELSLLGNAYIHKVREDFRLNDEGQPVVNEGLPVACWPLMGQYVVPKSKDGRVIGYQYNLGQTPIFYPKKDIIHIRFVSHENPFGPGYGPVRASYERILLAKYELAHLSSLFKNQSRFDSLISLKGGATQDQCERMQKELNLRFRQGGMGGPWVVDGEDLDVKPLSWSPKDTLSIELYKWTKLQIINAFGLNLDIFDKESGTRATAITARRQAQENAVEPRLRMIEERLNADLCPEFDERLLVEFDSPVEEDQDFELQKRKDYLAAGVYSVRYVQELEGIPEEYVTPKQDPAMLDQASRSSVGGSAAILSLQQAVYAKQLPREAAIANVVSVFGLEEAEAATMFPDIEVKPPQPAPGATPPNAPNEVKPEVKPPVPEQKAMASTRKVWVKDGGNVCPQCEKLHGTELDMDQFFKGTDGYEVLQPPLHPNCACHLEIVNSGEKFVKASTFQESDHPRANDGKFGSGGGSSSAASHAKPSKKPSGKPGKEGKPGKGSKPPKEGPGSKNDPIPAEKCTPKSVKQGLLKKLTTVKLNAQDVAAKAGQQYWDAMSDKEKKLVTQTMEIGHTVEHFLQKWTGFTATQKLCDEVIKEKNLSPERATRVTNITKWADFLSKWSLNVVGIHQVAHEVLHEHGTAGNVAAFCVAKVGFYIAAASAAYLVAHPFSTWKAAKRLLSGVTKSFFKVMKAMDKSQIEALADALGEAKDEELFEAVFMAAFDQTHEFDAALKLAIEKTKGEAA